MSTETIRVGTRGSPLARIQTQWVLERLRERHPGLRFAWVIIQTAGDVHTHDTPARLAGKGFFTREIEDALLSRRIDLAVHSLKDLPTACPVGLALGGIPEREEPLDVLVGCSLAELSRAPARLRLGTSSLRRKAQLRRAFPGCVVVDLRGNLDTRLRKTRDGTVDAAVLAAAGLLRLGRGAEISARLGEDIMLPAPGQGALALQIRADDAPLRQVLAAIHSERTHQCVGAERAFMHALGGGCQLPVAALATETAGALRLRGRVLSLDGARCLDACREGLAAHAEELGRALAGELVAQGAVEILAQSEARWREEQEHG